ncbi:MAG: lipoyl(octanoyl) transferase LipB [Gammaproteobacteria bacterium]|nr:lipoyl(octanoyl) transferase LipB [Gammaproteobacteria bacterium]
MPDVREQLCVRHLGRADYLPTWHAMQTFTRDRGPDTPDELWLLEHPPVFTLGLNGKPEHLLDPGDIPVIPIDRGGQVTYHGPGQLVAYLLVDLERRPLGVQALVRTLEQAVIDLLADYGVTARARREAPGVYVDGGKVAALGLRVKKGRCYHGLALNVAMDLEPFARINPCGYPGQAVTQLRDLGISAPIEQVSTRLQAHLEALLGYTGRPEEPVAPTPHD